MPVACDPSAHVIHIRAEKCMELKTARLTLLIDPAKKEAFERLCAQQDLTPSQVVRQLIRGYLAEHGVSWAPSGRPGGNEPVSKPGRGARQAASPESKARPRR